MCHGKQRDSRWHGREDDALLQHVDISLGVDEVMLSDALLDDLRHLDAASAAGIHSVCEQSVRCVCVKGLWREA